MANKHPTPITVFCKTTEQALELSAADKDSCVTITGPGTLSFHSLIAGHGAGDFTTLYVPERLRGTFKPPVGGVVREAE